MRYGTLPAEQTKKDEAGKALPNTVKVSNSFLNKSKVTDEQKKTLSEEEVAKLTTVVFEFPAQIMEFPQYDTLAEFIADCGSDERALEVLNEVTEKFATAAGKTAIRTASSGTPDEIIEAGIRVSKNYSWKVETKLSIKDKATKYDELMASAATLSPEELMARIMELQGK